MRVVDGDTLSVLLFTGQRVQVRLVGVNAPDLGECYYDMAKTSATALALGKRVVLVRDVHTPIRDDTQRLLAYVWIAGEGEDLGYQQVLAGHARVARRTFERRAVYLQVERSARIRERSLWGQCQGRRR
jgi:micrococcal nuclease